MNATRNASRSFVGAGLTIRLLPREAYCARYTPEQPVAGFALESQEGIHAFASDRLRPFYAAAGGLAFTPAGCSIHSQSEQGGEYLTMTGEENRLAALSGSDDTGLPSERFTGRVQEEGIRAAYAMRRILLSGDCDICAIETAIGDFIAAIIDAGGSTWRRPRAANSMTLRRLKMIEELIDARFSEPISISDMAETCGLSAGHFLRAFRAATGETPHHFLMNRRIAEARRLLDRPEFGIAEIAAMAGFCSQSHLTTAFKTSLGMTPGAYRSLHRSWARLQKPLFVSPSYR